MYLCILGTEVCFCKLHALLRTDFSYHIVSLQNVRNRSTEGVGSAASFSDDEDATLFSGSKSTKKGKKELSQSLRYSRDIPEAGKTTGRGRGRGRGRASNTLKQTTLDASMGFRHSQRLGLVVNASEAAF